MAYLADDDAPLKIISDQGKYPGVEIYSHPNMNGAITLGNMIFTNPNMEGVNTLDHEYGHYLDFKFHFQYNDSGSSSFSWSSEKSLGLPDSSNSDSGTSNFPGSNGGPNTAKNKRRTNVINLNVGGPRVTHGNIQSRQKSTIQHAINNHITQYNKNE